MTTKRCPRCGETKPVDAFAKDRSHASGLQTECRACRLVRDREHYAKSPHRRVRIRERAQERMAMLRDWLVGYLAEHPCVDCGETDLLVLEFDHVRGEKTNEVTRMVRQLKPLAEVQAEVEKCEVRCANCHRRRTALVLGSWRTQRA